MSSFSYRHVRYDKSYEKINFMYIFMMFLCASTAGWYAAVMKGLTLIVLCNILTTWNKM